MMLTLNLMRLSILILAGFAAVSAVAGLGEVFKAIFWPIAIVGIGIELGKYVSVAYAYKEWDFLSLKFKSILVSFILVISILTSIGIFGFLGNSFQTGHVTAQKDELQIQQLSDKKVKLESRLEAIDVQVSELPPNFVNGRIRLMKAFDEERNVIRLELKGIIPQLEAIQTSSITTTSSLGPIVYLAKVFGTTVDTAVLWMMVALTLCLDPFALFLVILINRTQHGNSKTEVSIKDISFEPEPKEIKPEKKRVRTSSKGKPHDSKSVTVEESLSTVKDVSDVVNTVSKNDKLVDVFVKEDDSTQVQNTRQPHFNLTTGSSS